MSDARYLKLSADCIPVRGATNTAIYDLTRREVTLIPASYHRLFALVEQADVMQMLEDIKEAGLRQKVAEFVEFLLANEFAYLTENISCFPVLDTVWQGEGTHYNAIIDVDAVPHDFQRIFRELDSIGCRFVQIRCYSNLIDAAVLAGILEAAANKSMTSLSLLLKYHEGLPPSELTRILSVTPHVTECILHSAPLDEKIEVPAVQVLRPGANDASSASVLMTLLLTRQEILSETHCGIIDQAQITPPSISTFSRLLHSNGCMHGKISIDRNGIVKNCPSQQRSFGTVNEVSLVDVFFSQTFRSEWLTTKDAIQVCKDCEFRYGCSDCRAYLQDSSDRRSKPLKCGYDPYKGAWSNSDQPATIGWTVRQGQA